MVLMDFETSQTENDWNELYNLLSEDDDFEDVLPEAADYYFELLEMGPAGFYEEFCNDLDFSDEFKAEYGGFCEDEDPEGLDDFDESSNDEQTKTKLKEDQEKELSWDDFSSPETDRIEKEYLPYQGEGNNMMTQAATACCKLIYKWFNDSDVYDTTGSLKGWANDLSDYANWLDENIPETSDILNRIFSIHGSEDECEKQYTKLLYDLMNTVFTQDMANKYAPLPKVNSVYKCPGPFEFYEAPTCPYCGNEMDEYEERRYGMCQDCWDEQQADEEDE